MEERKFKIVAFQVPPDEGLSKKCMVKAIDMIDSDNIHCFWVIGENSIAHVFVDANVADFVTLEDELGISILSILDDVNNERDDCTYLCAFLETEFFLDYGTKEIYNT